jgi:hypothetical protein
MLLLEAETSSSYVSSLQVRLVLGDWPGARVSPVTLSMHRHLHWLESAVSRSCPMFPSSFLCTNTSISWQVRSPTIASGCGLNQQPWTYRTVSTYRLIIQYPSATHHTAPTSALPYSLFLSNSLRLRSNHLLHSSHPQLTHRQQHIHQLESAVSTCRRVLSPQPHSQDSFFSGSHFKEDEDAVFCKRS